MIPDKIYVPTEYTDNDITPVGVTLQQVFPNDVCYIRKEALLEWLEQNRNQAQMWFDRYNDREDLSAKQVWEKVIGKLNEI